MGPPPSLPHKTGASRCQHLTAIYCVSSRFLDSHRAPHSLSLSRVSHRSDTLSQLKQPYSFSDYPLSLSPASRTAFEVFGSIQWTIPLFPPSEVPANRSSDGPATSADLPPSPHCLHHSDSLPDSKNLLHEVLQPAAPRRATLTSPLMAHAVCMRTWWAGENVVHPPILSF